MNQPVVTFTVEEYARVRESFFHQGEASGRGKEREDMAQRLSSVRRQAEEFGGTYRLPIIEPIQAPGSRSPRSSMVIAEFTAAQLRALETLFCGRSEP
jgi:hypothetical protein